VGYGFIIHKKKKGEKGQEHRENSRIESG